MEQPPTGTPVFVGIDVSKDRLDVRLRPSGEAFAVPRDAPGLDRLAAELRGLAPALVVLEATGGFETTVAAALAGAGLPLAVVNPRQIRDFARATGRLAKTDRLDAEAIALFARRARRRWRAPSRPRARCWKRSSPISTATSATPSAAPPLGAPRTTCSRACRASAPWPRAP